MTVKEVYSEVGGNYEDVISRLRTDERVARFLAKVASDGSFVLLEKSFSEKNTEEAFRAAHTIKGVCMNLSLTKLYDSSSRLTEVLRGRTAFGDDLSALFEEVKKDYLHTVECINKLN